MNRSMIIQRETEEWTLKCWMQPKRQRPPEPTLPNLPLRMGWRNFCHFSASIRAITGPSKFQAGYQLIVSYRYQQAFDSGSSVLKPNSIQPQASSPFQLPYSWLNLHTTHAQHMDAE
jgi:hypothetical protein